MGNFYTEIITKIENLITNEDYSTAMNIIENELAMPYIPNDIETKLKQLKKDIQGNLSKVRVFNSECLDDYLFSDDVNKSAMAINYLADSNIRKYLPQVSEFLVSDASDTLKCTLIDILAEQNVTDTLVVSKGGMEYEFVAAYLDRPCDSIVFNEVSQIINDTFAAYPTYCKMAMTVLVNQLFLYLPLSYDIDESEGLALSIMHYVLTLMEDLVLWEQISIKYHTDTWKMYEILV